MILELFICNLIQNLSKWFYWKIIHYHFTKFQPDITIQLEAPWSSQKDCYILYESRFTFIRKQQASELLTLIQYIIKRLEIAQFFFVILLSKVASKSAVTSRTSNANWIGGEGGWETGERKGILLPSFCRLYQPKKNKIIIHLTKKSFT